MSDREHNQLEKELSLLEQHWHSYSASEKNHRMLGMWRVLAGEGVQATKDDLQFCAGVIQGILTLDELGVYIEKRRKE